MPPTRDVDGYRNGPPDLVGVLWDALDDRYADADPADVAGVLDSALDSMSAAEALGFTNALQQIERAAGQALASPAVRQVAAAALPLAGTAVGGPVGGALGALAAQQLGRAAPAGPALPGPAAAPGPASLPAAPAAAGSVAALRALIGSQQSELSKALLAAAMGSYGRSAVNGIPVASLLAGFSQLLGEAAADADAAMYGAGESAEPADDAFADGHSLYTTLMDAAECELWAS
jgi:hypothetical protein